jgi:ATP-dependent RNA helicase HelY
VHQSRREGESTSAPPAVVLAALDQTRREWVSLAELESEHGLDTLTEPDPGLALAMHRWAKGQSLDVVLRDSDLAAGDFVRRCKQLVDMLGQIAADAPPDVQRSARSAMDAIRRGVVAHALTH